MQAGGREGEGRGWRRKGGSTGGCVSMASDSVGQCSKVHDKCMNTRDENPVGGESVTPGTHTERCDEASITGTSPPCNPDTHPSFPACHCRTLSGPQNSRPVVVGAKGRERRGGG
jgi:hypothetical protein